LSGSSPLTDYGDQLETLVLAPWREALDPFGALLEAVSENVTLMSDDEWRADMDVALAAIRVGNANLRDVDVPEEAQEHQGAMLDAAFEFEAMSVLIAEAIDEADMDKIGVALEAGARGSEHIAKVRDLSEMSEPTSGDEEFDSAGAVYEYAAELMKSGQSSSQIESKLVEKGIDKQNASVVVENLTRLRAEAVNNAAKRTMIIGGLVFVVGSIVTISTYTSASGGGTYVIAWGAIIFGAIQFFRGLSAYSGKF